MGNLGDELTPLPEYERPPVIEVIYGIRFEPVQAMLAPHLGILWEKFREDYPGCEEKPLLVNQGETIEFGRRLPLPRIWFIHESGNRLIQVQRDRFLHNWKEGSSSEAYPGFEWMKASYRQMLNSFMDFLGENEFGPLKLTSAEMTYVNHMVVGRDISSYSEIGRIFPDFQLKPREGLPEPQAFNWVTAFSLPESGVMLNAVIRNGSRSSDETQVVVFELSARKPPEDFPIGDLWNWFDTAHNAILSTFSKLTDERFQKDEWGRKC